MQNKKLCCRMHRKKNKTEDCHIINFHAGIYLWVLSQILYFHPPSNFKIYNMTGL